MLQDYKGQKLAEQIFQGIILISAVSKHDAFKLAIQISHYSKSFFTCSVSLISCIWFFQVIGFVYGLIIEQFGWTVYIVLGGFAISCVVSFCFVVLFICREGVLCRCLVNATGISCLLTLMEAHTTVYIMIFFFVRVCPLVDPASMAHVQTESSSLAASFTRDQRGAQPKTSGKSQEEEAQITQNHPCLAVNTSFLYWRLF